MAISITRSKAVKDTWKQFVFDTPEIQAITPIVMFHDITQDSHLEVASLRHNQKVNFFAFSVARAPYAMTTGGYRAIFQARTTYVKWAVPRGEAYFDCIDAIETIQETIINNLGDFWQGKVNGYELPREPSFPQLTNIVDEPVYQIQYNIVGLICHS